MRALHIIGCLTAIALGGCQGPHSELETSTEPDLPIEMALSIPLSFVTPMGWTTRHEGLATILRPANGDLSAPSISIQPIADGTLDPSAAIPLLKPAFKHQPEVARFTLVSSDPAIISGGPAQNYTAELTFLDMPMYRRGFIIPIGDLLVDIAITAPLTSQAHTDFILEGFTESLTLPTSPPTISRKGIGDNSRL